MGQQQERQAFLSSQIDRQLERLTDRPDLRLRIKALIESTMRALDDHIAISLMGIADRLQESAAQMNRDAALSDRGRAFFDRFSDGIRTSCQENRIRDLLGEDERVRLVGGDN